MSDGIAALRAYVVREIARIERLLSGLKQKLDAIDNDVRNAHERIGDLTPPRRPKAGRRGKNIP